MTVTAVAVVTALMGSAVPAQARPIAPPERAVAQAISSSEIAAPGLTPVSIARFDRYVHSTPSGGYRLDAPQSLIRANPEQVKQVRAAISVANTAVASERIAQNQSTGVAASDSAADQALEAQRRRHGGWSRHWWGVTAWMDAYATNKLIGLASIGAGVSAILAALLALGVVTSPGAIAMAIVSGIITIGAGVLQVCSNSRGVRLYKPWVGVPYCRGR